MRRVLCEAIIARLARFPIELNHYPQPRHARKMLSMCYNSEYPISH
jgi:hypothetical protein